MNISELLHYSLKPQYWPELQRTIDNWEDNVDGEYERNVERSANLWYLAEQAIADYVQENGINLTDSEIESLCYRTYSGAYPFTFKNDCLRKNWG